MQIMPSVLVTTPDEFVQQIEKLNPFFQHFQIDIADGEFVPNKTISIEELETAISRLVSAAGLTFDFDLMVKNVASHLNVIDKIRQHVKVDAIFVHNHDAVNTRPNLGIAIDPQITVETINQRFDLTSLAAIEVMSIIPGGQERAFIPETLNKIGGLRKAGYKSKIYLDGGINNQTIPMIIEKEHRPDVLCIGSYLTHSENAEERISQLQKMIMSG